MAVKARAEITISRIVDVEKIVRYYLLQSSTAATPSKPTTTPPGGSWVTTEPAFSSGATKTLYFVDLTVMTNGTYSYSAVSKSSSYEAAKEAWNKANNAQNTANDANNKIDLAEKTGTGGNLIKNGYGELLDNTNFKNGTFTRGDCPDGCYGYFTNGETEKIPFNPNLTYKLEYYVRLHKGASGNNYFSIVPYDIDGLCIECHHILWYNTDLFYLSQDLQNGDTVAQFADLNKWRLSTQAPYQRSFLIFGYKDSTGYTYPDGTYSRNYYGYVYTDDSSVDKVNNVITLRSPWKGGTVKAGTCIGQSSEGSTYCYYGQRGSLTNTDWKKYTAIVVANNGDSHQRRLLYAKSIAVYLFNSVADYAKLYLGERKISDAYNEYYLSTSKTSLSGGSWSVTAPEWVNGRYMWSRTVKVDGFGNKTYSPSINGVCIAGATGSNGKGIRSTKMTYQAGTSATTAPTGTWSDVPQKTDSSKPYLWTKIVITYDDGTTSDPAYSVSSTMDSVNVGGRNLLKQYIRAGNCTVKVDKLTVKVGTALGDTFFYLKPWEKLEKGETYTISCIASNVPSGCKWDFRVRHQSSSFRLIIDKNGKCFSTGVMYDSVEAGAEFIIDDISNGRPSVAPNIILSKFKLEKGNIATDWTPAPEDLLDKSTYESYVQQTDRKIAAKLESSEYNSFQNGEYFNFKKSTNTFIGTSEKWEMKWDKIFNTVNAQEDTYQSYITFAGGNIKLGNSKSDVQLNLFNDNILFSDTNGKGLAKFEKDKISLGMDGGASIIDLCNGTGVIKKADPTTNDKRLLIESDDSVEIITGTNILLKSDNGNGKATIDFGSNNAAWNPNSSAGAWLDIEVKQTGPLGEIVSSIFEMRKNVVTIGTTNVETPSGTKYSTGINIIGDTDIIDIYCGSMRIQRGSIESDVILANSKTLRGYDKSGVSRALAGISSDNDINYGYGTYQMGNRYTYLYGGKGIIFHLKNPEAKWSPFICAGMSINIPIGTSGFITTSGKDVYFIVPISVPIIGNPTVSVSSINGLQVRQNNKYLYGSSATTWAKPSSYTASVVDMKSGIQVVAKMSNATNVINNDACGIYASIKITFS